MDPIEVGWRYRSYVRRKKCEAELLANTVVGALVKRWAVAARRSGAGAVVVSNATNEREPARTATPDRQVVPAHQFFKILESR